MSNSYPYLAFARAHSVDYGKVLSFVDLMRHRNLDVSQFWQTEAVNEIVAREIVGLNLIKFIVERHPETLGNTKHGVVDFALAVDAAISYAKEGRYAQDVARRFLDIVHAG